MESIPSPDRHETRANPERMIQPEGSTVMPRKPDRTWTEADDTGMVPARAAGSTRVSCFNREAAGFVAMVLISLAWLADERTLVDSGQVHRFPGEPGRRTVSMVLSDDGVRLATADSDGSVAVRNTRIGWRFERFLSSILITMSNRSHFARAVDSWPALAGGRRHGPRPGRGRRAPDASHPLDRVRLVAFSPDRRTLVALTDRDGRIVLWDLRGSRVARILRGPDPVACLSFTPDGRSLISGGIDRDATILIWDLETGRSRRLRGENLGPIVAIALSKDGRLLASASGHDHGIRLWDLARGTFERSIEGHAYGTTGLDFSPDGTSLATAGNDGVVRIWDVSTGRPQAVLDGA